MSGLKLSPVKLLAMAVLSLALLLLPGATSATPMKFWKASSIAFTNSDSASPHDLTILIHDAAPAGQDIGPNVLYTITQSIAASGEYVLDMSATPNDALPQHAIYSLEYFADATVGGIVTAEYRLRLRSPDVYLNNFTDRSGTYSVTYLQSGSPVPGYRYPGMPIAAQQALYLGTTGFSPPPTYDGVQIGASVAVEAYSRGTMPYAGK